jgi:hypothetical protein
VSTIKPASFHRALDVCWELHAAGGEVEKPLSAPGVATPAVSIRGIISVTAGRTEQTFAAVLNLAANDFSQQGAMLMRSMFEDVAVVHWLLLHEDEESHYVGCFERHRNAMRLALDRAAEQYDGPREDVSDIKPDEADLISEFGKYAQRSWWEANAQGERVKLPQLVEQIGSARRFWGRTYGETPVFAQHYDVVNKWANQFLHHTALGATPVQVGNERATLAAPRAVDVVARAYYLYAMAICAALDANGTTPQTTPFWDQFMEGFPILVMSTGADE